MKKYVVILFVLFWGETVSVSGQNIDSLYAVFQSSRGAGRIATANEIFKHAYEIELMDSMFLVKATDEREYVDASVIEVVGAYYDYIEANYPKSIEFHKQAIEIFEKLGIDHSVNKLNGSIGANYARMGDYEQAVAYMLKCYEWEKNAGDHEGLSSTLNDLGVVYNQLGKSEQAIHFFEEALIVERPLNRPLQYASRLAQLAREYSQIDAEKALALIKEALLHDAKIELPRLKEERIAIHTVIMGDVYFRLNRAADAEKCYQQSLAFFENNGRTLSLANTLLSLGRLQVMSERWSAAVATLRRCEEIAEQNSMMRLQHDACLLLVEAYNKLYANDAAYSYFKKHLSLIGAIYREAGQRQINDFQVKYETAEKQIEIERQKAEIDRRRTQQFLFVGSLIAAGLLLLLLTYIVALRTRHNRALTERNDALAETNALKDKFFSIISHDLRNPALTQRDTLKLLAANANKFDADTLTDYLQDTHKLADGLVDLLTGLLEWSKVQTGRMEYKPSSFNLIAALQPDIDVVKSMALHKNIGFDTLMPPRAGVTTDENMLKTVVRNLLTNAVKFTAAGGNVCLEIKEVTKNKYKERAVHLISVSDTGTGMTPEQIDNLFRLDSRQTREGTSGEQSSGIGLIVCRDMLEKNGSTLHVESEEGKGSRFWFEI